GVFAEVLAGAGAAVVAVDVAEAALRRAHRRLPALDVRLAPIDGELPLEDNAFELVWASEVIEHIADTARWLSEIRRVLAPGGRAVWGGRCTASIASRSRSATTCTCTTADRCSASCASSGSIR